MLELKNISYIVNEDGKEKAILKDINLTVDEHFVAITGPNGGGKSTLAKIIAGIIRPTTGQILLDVVEKYYNENSMFALKNKSFHLAELGNDAGIYGAVRLIVGA